MPKEDARLRALANVAVFSKIAKEREAEVKAKITAEKEAKREVKRKVKRKAKMEPPKVNNIKIIIEISDANELTELKDWLSAMPKFEIQSKLDLNQSIALFEFTTRTRNSLRCQGIETVGDLIQRSRKELLSLPSFGVRSLREVTEALSIYDPYLRGNLR